MSDIFNEYAKIAIDQGLIKKAQKKNNTKSTKSKYDSVDLDAVQMLYGIKPNDEQEHIVEQAHPNSVVIAPAYDRANGLVENLLERQNIMVDIALKPNDGKHVQRSYVVAHNKLLNEVIKTAFMLDKKGESDLMKLADSCAGRLKEAQLVSGTVSFLLRYGPLIWKGIKWVGTALLGSKILYENVNTSHGLMNDLDYAIDQINDVPNVAFNTLITALSNLRASVESASTYRQGLSDILTEASSDNPSKETLIYSTGEYDKELETFFTNYKKQLQKTRNIVIRGIHDVALFAEQNQGDWGGWLDFIRQTYRMIEPSEEEDIIRALGRLVSRKRGGLITQEGSIDKELIAVNKDLRILRELSYKNKEVLRRIQNNEVEVKSDNDNKVKDLVKDLVEVNGTN